MAVTITQLAAELRIGDGMTIPPEPIFGNLSRALATAHAIVFRYAPAAPEDVRDTAAIRVCAYLYNSDPAGSRNLYTNAMTQSGAAGLLDQWRGVQLILADGTPAGDDESMMTLAEILEQLAEHNNATGSHPHLISLIDAANQNIDTGITGHNANQISHPYLIGQIDQLRGAINMLGGDVADINLARILFRWFTWGGRTDRGRLQWSIDTGNTWLDILPFQGVAFDHIAAASWAQDGNNDYFPVAKYAPAGVIGQFLQLTANGARWGSIPGRWAATFGTQVPTLDNITVLQPGGLFIRVPDDESTAVGLYLRLQNSFQHIVDIARFGQGGGGTPGQGGLDQNEVDGRIRALVHGSVRIPRVGTILPAMLLSSGLNANRWVRIAANGQSFVGYDAPTWLDDPAIRFPLSKMGQNSANNTIFGVLGNIGTYLTYVQLVSLIKGALYAQLDTDSDEISHDGSGHLDITAPTPTAAQLLPRFKDDQVEVEGDKLNITIQGGGGLGYNGSTRVLNQQNLSTNRAGGSIVSSFELPAVTQGERIHFIALINIITAGAANADLGPHRLSLSDTSPLSEHANGWVEDRDFIRGGTILDPDEVGTYGIDGPDMISYVSGAVTVYLHRTQDGNADPDVRYGIQIYALRYGGQGVAGVTDYGDLSGLFIKKGDPNQIDPKTETADALWWQGHFHIKKHIGGTDAAWTTRAFGDADLSLGQVYRTPPADTFVDLPAGANGDVRWIIDDPQLFAYIVAGLEMGWVGGEYSMGRQMFDSEDDAREWAARHYTEDGVAGAVGEHPGWYDEDGNAQFNTVTHWTARVPDDTVWARLERPLEDEIDTVNGRVDHVETDILDGLSVWRGTIAEYDALTDDEKMDTTVARFTPRPTS